ncbi:MAG TPA: hypothetical protein VJ911_01955, partial [Cryomorphaceae bacterium]|nr:hypothetical protein [Cryomorphaceae bacterium]
MIAFKRIFIATAILWLSACSDVSEENSGEFETGNSIVGLASPVKLKTDTTNVFLLDYFESAALV